MSEQIDLQTVTRTIKIFDVAGAELGEAPVEIQEWMNKADVVNACEDAMLEWAVAHAWDIYELSWDW